MGLAGAKFTGTSLMEKTAHTKGNVKMRIQNLMQNSQKRNPVIVSHFQMKSLTEEEQSKNTQWFVNFPNCPPGRKAVLKQLPKPELKAKLPRSSPPHSTNHEMQTWQAERSENHKSTAGQDPPSTFQIHPALLANPPEGSLLWNENMQRAQISKSQDSLGNQR